MFLTTIKKNLYDVINWTPSSTRIPLVSASNHVTCRSFLISSCGNKLWSVLIKKSRYLMQGPPQDSDSADIWRCWHSDKFWRMARTPGYQTCNVLSEKAGEGYGPSTPIPFVREPALPTKNDDQTYDNWAISNISQVATNNMNCLFCYSTY